MQEEKITNSDLANLINKLTVKVDDNSKSIDTLTTKVDDNSKSIDTLTTKVDDNSKSINTLTTKVDDNSKSINTLTTKVDGNSKSIDSLNTKVNTLADKIDDNSKSIDLIAQTTAEILEKMATKKELGEVTTGLEQVKTDLKDFKQETRGNFGKVNEKLDEITDLVLNHHERIEVLEEKVGV